MIVDVEENIKRCMALDRCWRVLTNGIVPTLYTLDEVSVTGYEVIYDTNSEKVVKVRYHFLPNGAERIIYVSSTLGHRLFFTTKEAAIEEIALVKLRGAKGIEGTI